MILSILVNGSTPNHSPIIRFSPFSLNIQGSTMSFMTSSVSYCKQTKSGVWSVQSIGYLCSNTWINSRPSPILSLPVYDLKHRSTLAIHIVFLSFSSLQTGKKMAFNSIFQLEIEFFQICGESFTMHSPPWTKFRFSTLSFTFGTNTTISNPNFTNSITVSLSNFYSLFLFHVSNESSKCVHRMVSKYLYNPHWNIFFSH